MLVSVSLFSGLTSVSTVPAGRRANAALVGAKTVNGPLPDSVSTRPAALTAATSVVWSFELTALATIVLFGIHGGAADHRVLGGERGAGGRARRWQGRSDEVTCCSPMRSPGGLRWEIRRRRGSGCSAGLENQARTSVALATTGPVGSPVGDPPTGSNEMASVVPALHRRRQARVGLDPVAGDRGTAPAVAARRCRRSPTIARCCLRGSASARASTAARRRCRRWRRSAS